MTLKIIAEVVNSKLQENVYLTSRKPNCIDAKIIYAIIASKYRFIHEQIAKEIHVDQSMISYYKVKFNYYMINKSFALKYKICITELESLYINNENIQSQINYHLDQIKFHQKEVDKFKAILLS